MSIAHQLRTATPSAADHSLADPEHAPSEREFACLATVTHLSPTDLRTVRTVPGVTGVIDDDTSAEVYLIVAAGGPRSARQVCAEQICGLLPAAVVTVTDVVDYNQALVSFLDRHGESPDVWESAASFDDAEAVMETFDRH